MLNKEIIEKISSNPDICHGKPCIKGTRIPIYLIVSMIAKGEKEEDILKIYPSLTKKDIQVALKYASKLCEYLFFLCSSVSCGFYILKFINSNSL